MKASTIPSTRTTLTATFAHTDFGLALIGLEGPNIKTILLGDSEEELIRDLRERFPDVLIESAAPSAQTEEIVRALNHPEQISDLSLAPEGTDFQKQVWRELRKISVGQTATYGEIAGRLGKPDAVRAVGTACGANPIAVLIPCHRVVRSGGGLAGYRWGLERKQALLAREHAKA